MVILKHLNEDTSWLVQFTFDNAPFNILIDPWLKGPQTDYWKLFSTQWHAVPSCVEHISELGVDVHAVVISHEWTDHCHKATLLEVPKTAAVYATDKAADIIRSWKHFQNVYNIPALAPGQKWNTSSINGLPKQLGIARAVSAESDFQYYHSAVCISYQPEVDASGQAGAHTIVYTPHGIPWSSLNSLQTNGIEEISALLHGLHEVTNPKVLGGKLNLGGRNAVQVAHNCKPRLWIGTHDEVKVGKGLVSKVLKRRIWSVEEALKEEGLVEGNAQFRALRSGEQIEFE